VVIGAGHKGFAQFHRLAQGFEHTGLEFRQLIEEQNAMVGQRHFAGLWL
jgi:hypothetical protein